MAFIGTRSLIIAVLASALCASTATAGGLLGGGSGSGLGGLGGALGGTVGGVGGGVGGVVGGVGSTAGGVVGGAVNTVGGIVGGTGSGVLGGGSVLGGSIGSGTGSGLGGAIGGVGSTVGGTLGTVGGAVGGVGSTVGGAVSGITGGGSGPQGGAAGAVSGALGAAPAGLGGSNRGTGGSPDPFALGDSFFSGGAPANGTALAGIQPVAGILHGNQISRSVAPVLRGGHKLARTAAPVSSQMHNRKAGAKSANGANKIASLPSTQTPAQASPLAPATNIIGTLLSPAARGTNSPAGDAAGALPLPSTATQTLALVTTGPSANAHDGSGLNVTAGSPALGNGLLPAGTLPNGALPGLVPQSIPLGDTNLNLAVLPQNTSTLASIDLGKSSTAAGGLSTGLPVSGVANSAAGLLNSSGLLGDNGTSRTALTLGPSLQTKNGGLDVGATTTALGDVNKALGSDGLVVPADLGVVSVLADAVPLANGKGTGVNLDLGFPGGGLIPGLPGLPGLNGNNGNDGADGSNGTNGTNGTTTIITVPGGNGSNGNDGSNGGGGGLITLGSSRYAGSGDEGGEINSADLLRLCRAIMQHPKRYDAKRVATCRAVLTRVAPGGHKTGTRATPKKHVSRVELEVDQATRGMAQGYIKGRSAGL